MHWLPCHAWPYLELLTDAMTVTPVRWHISHLMIFTLGVLLGCLGLQQEAALWQPSSWSIMAALLVMVLILHSSLKRCHSETNQTGRLGVKSISHFFIRGLSSIPTLLLAIVLGFSWASWRADWRLREALPLSIEGQDVRILASINSLPSSFERGLRFQVHVLQVDTPGLAQQIPRHLAISWYHEGGFDQADTTPLCDNLPSLANLQPGQLWRMTVRLKRPHGNANPGGFDYEYWLMEEGIRATGYLRDKPAPVLLETSQLDGLQRWQYWLDLTIIEQWRSTIRARIQAALSQQPYAGVIVALVVGDQQSISNSDWQRFNLAAVSHLLAISGVHITMLAWLCGGLMAWLWRRSFWLTGWLKMPLPLRIPAPLVGAVSGGVVAFIYALLAGMGIPAQRTLLMLAVVIIAMLLKRRPPASHVLCLALLVVLLCDPWAVMAAGFWLSFAAVGLLMWQGRAALSQPQDRPSSEFKSLSKLQQGWRTLQSATRAQLAVTLGLLPLTLLLFQQVSLIGPLANALAIPLISFVITPLSLLAIFLPDVLAQAVWNLAASLFSLLAQWINWLLAWPMVSWQAAQPPIALVLLAGLGLVMLFAPLRGTRLWLMRIIGMLACLPLLFNQPARPAAGQLWMTVIDIGQGNAILLETARHRLLYDTGPQFNEESNAGNRTIVPYLRTRGIQTLDGLMVSHRDNDHSGGLASIMQTIPVAWLSTSIELPWLAAQGIVPKVINGSSEVQQDSQLSSQPSTINRNPVIQRCEAGQSWQWDGIDFTVLHPTASSYEYQKLKTNARSCVLQVRVGQQQIILPGDMEADQELELLARTAEPYSLHATILMAPHHGSKTSSSPNFLAAVAPRLTLFQMGYRNRYGHPAAEVVARYQQLGLNTLRTDQTGAVQIKLDSQSPADTFSTDLYRLSHPRYWYGR